MIFHAGEAEGLKLSVHAVGLVVGVVCFAYNAAAFVFVRHERHLLVNALVYGLLIGFEEQHVACHARRRSAG